MQTRTVSAYEATANIAAGIILQYVLAFTVLRALGFNISLRQNIIITLVMTLASFARQYIIRRLFERGT